MLFSIILSKPNIVVLRRLQGPEYVRHSGFGL